MRKRIILPMVLALTLMMSYIAVSANERRNRSDVPQQVLELVENHRITYSLTKEKYTIGEKAYKVNYIKELDLNEEYPSLKNLMEEKVDQWLYIVEDKGDSHAQMLIGRQEGRYQVLMSGGSAEMFYHTLSLADRSLFSEADLLSYGGDLYLLNHKDEVFQVPATRTDYLKNPDLYDTPLSGEVSRDMILRNYRLYLEMGNGESRLGSIGLAEQYQEENK